MTTDGKHSEPASGPTAVADLVTTVIPVYNRAGMVTEAVDSVLAQTHRPIEIIVVDDGSTDETADVVDRLAARHPEVRAIHTPNAGPGAAREAGRRLASGEFLQYLDSDDLLLPAKFSTQVAALRALPHCGIAYGITRLLAPDGSVLREASKWTGERRDSLFPGLLVDRWWHTHTPLYRRSLCDRIGPWPRSRPEDWDYDARAGALRTPLAYSPTPVSCHRQHGGHRVSAWALDPYLEQEAEFLPRLYACAVEAGVDRHSPEMRHFTRWAFALSRRLGARGLGRQADELLSLAARAAGGFSPAMRWVQWAARCAGWRLVGSACAWRDRRLSRGPGTLTLPNAWQR